MHYSCVSPTREKNCTYTAPGARRSFSALNHRTFNGISWIHQEEKNFAYKLFIRPAHLPPSEPHQADTMIAQGRHLIRKLGTCLSWFSSRQEACEDELAVSAKNNRTAERDTILELSRAIKETLVYFQALQTVYFEHTTYRCRWQLS